MPIYAHHQISFQNTTKIRTYNLRKIKKAISKEMDLYAGKNLFKLNQEN